MECLKKINERRKLNEKHRHCLGRDNSLACLFLAIKFKVLFNVKRKRPILLKIALSFPNKESTVPAAKRAIQLTSKT